MIINSAELMHPRCFFMPASFRAYEIPREGCAGGPPMAIKGRCAVYMDECSGLHRANCISLAK